MSRWTWTQKATKNDLKCICVSPNRGQMIKTNNFSLERSACLSCFQEKFAHFQSLCGWGLLQAHLQHCPQHSGFKPVYATICLHIMQVRRSWFRITVNERTQLCLFAWYSARTKYARRSKFSFILVSNECMDCTILSTRQKCRVPA